MDFYSLSFVYGGRAWQVILLLLVFAVRSDARRENRRYGLDDPAIVSSFFSRILATVKPFRRVLQTWSNRQQKALGRCG